MPDRVTIPAPLAAEIAADLAAGGDRAKRWQPQVEGPLLLLASSGWLAPGRVVHMQFDHGPVCLHVQGASMGVATPGFWLRHAWASVGGVDGGPRPVEGDRILVLTDTGGDCPEPWIGHVTYASWGNLPIGAVMAGGRTDLAAEESAVTRWAILPPEIPTKPGQELEDAPSDPTGLGEQPTPGEASEMDSPHDGNDMYELAIHIPMSSFTTTPNDDPRIDQVVHHARGLFPSASATGGPAWPEDGPTQCPTCGAVDRDERRHRAHEDAEGTLRELVRWLAAERERMRGMNNHRYDHQADAYSLVLDHLRDQGLDVDYLAEPDTREQT